MRRASIKRTSGRAPAPPTSKTLWEYVSLRDLGDCLLEAYDSVARRAHERFLERGAQAGGELEDWLAAERELLHVLSVHVKETDNAVYALACVPNSNGAGLSIGVEATWLAIVVHADGDGTDGNETIPADMQEMFYTIGHDAEGGGRCDSAQASERTAAWTRAFSIQQLPAQVDPMRSVAVFSKGVLGIRMPKVDLSQNA